jgi:hypothetical protein
MSFRFKVKSNVSDDAEVSWQSGKMSVKIEVNWKGETATTDRKGELDMTYEYRVRYYLLFSISILIDMDRYFI